MMKAAFKVGLLVVKVVVFTSSLIFLVHLFLMTQTCSTIAQVLSGMRPFKMYDIVSSPVSCSAQSKWRTLDDLFRSYKYKLQKRSQDRSITSWSVANKQPIGDYAVFSSSTRGHPNTNALYLIFTALAWRKVGKESIVVITGEIAEWQERSTLRYIIEHLVRMPVTLILMQTKEHDVIMSQTGRLFVSSMLKWENEMKSNVITTDADLWPLKADYYHIPPDKDIAILNSDCCGHFTREKTRYKLLPISNIIMSVATWKSVMMPYNTEPRGTAGIIQYIMDDLGHSRSSKLHVGRADEIVWNADQIIISRRITEYKEKNTEDALYYSARWLWADRIEKDLSLSGFVFAKDVHLSTASFGSTNTWNKLQKLLSLIYGSDNDQQWNSLFNHYQKCITIESQLSS